MCAKQGYRCAGIVWAGCLGLFITALALGAPPTGKGDKSTTRPASLEDQIRQQQAAAWSAFYSGKYEDAVKLADPLLKAPKDWARVEAGHCQARAYWVAGTKASQAKAQQLWSALEKASTLNANKERMNIAKALAAEAKGQDIQAVELLEQSTGRKLTDTCTAEAAIELAHLYVKSKEFDKAKDVLNFAVSFLQSGGKGELSSIAAEPFIAAAKAAIAHLPYDQDPGREQFEQADALRNDKKFREAAKAYQAVMKDFPKTDFAPRSEMSIGLCMVGLNLPEQAVEHWKKFITTLPAGSWRGQALVGIIDVCLEDTLSLTEADKWSEIAGASVESGLGDDKAGPSWKKCALDIHLRRGLVAFLMEKNKTAVEAFEQAKTAARLSGSTVDESTGIVKGLDRLIAAAKANKPVTPDEVHDAKADKRVALLCAMGTIYNCTEQYIRAESTFSRIAVVEFTPAKTKSKPPATTGPADDDTAAPPALVIKVSKGPSGQNASAAQFSYALFGLGAAFQGQAKLPQAKECFLADLKTFSDATWHDETLHRVAMIIWDAAEDYYIRATMPMPDKDDLKPGQIRMSVTTRDREVEGITASKIMSQAAKAKSEALPYLQELIRRYPDSQYVQISRYCMGLIFAGLEQWGDAEKSFTKLVDSSSQGPFAGESLFILSKIILEQKQDVEAAGKYLAKLHEWVTQTRQIQTSGNSPLLTATPPRKAADGTGRIAILGAQFIRQALSLGPVHLRDCYRCSWYLDDLVSRYAATYGFTCFAQGRNDEALKAYDMLLQTDPVVQRSEAANEWSDYRRLKWGAEHGYLVAYPQELKFYNQKQRFIVLLADFYYVTQRFEEAAGLYRRLLGKAYGSLSEAQQDYPNYAIGMCIIRGNLATDTMFIGQAVAQFEKVLAHGEASWTQQRALAAIANYGAIARDSAIRDVAARCQKRLAYSKADNEFTHQARIAVGMDLLMKGQKDEGVKMLHGIPQEDKGAYDWAQELLKQLDDPQSTLSQMIKRAQTVKVKTNEPHK